MISMKNKITIDRDDLIIFEGVSRKTKKPYCVVRFKHEVMFKPEYVAQLKQAGVKAYDMTELEV